MITDVRPFRLPDIDGHCPGWIVKGHIFRKEKAHMLRSPPGFTIDANLFALLPRYGVDVIQMKDINTGKEYVCSYKTFNDNRVPGGVDRGNGKNEALALSFWRVF